VIFLFVSVRPSLVLVCYRASVSLTVQCDIHDKVREFKTHVSFN
jgi:hypothetical protein